MWFLSGAAEFRRDGRFRYEAQGRIETADARGLPVHIGAEGWWSALGSRRVSLAHNDGRVRVWVAAGGEPGLLQRSTYRQLSGERALALLVWSPSEGGHPMWPFILATALALGRAFGPGLGPTPPAAVGRYALVAVGDRALPALWQESDLGNGVRLRAYWVGGLAELRADLSYRVSLTLRANGPGVYGQPVVTTLGGSFRELPGGRLELNPARGGTVYWQLTGDTLTSRALVRGSGEARSRPAEFVFVRAVTPSSPVPIP